MLLVSSHRWNRTTTRAANVTLTSQYFVAVHFTRAKQTAATNAWGGLHADLILFGLARSYEVLLFNGDPCAWLYIEVAVMALVTHRWTLGTPIKTFLMSWEGPQSSRVARHERQTRTPNLQLRTSDSWIWFFLSFAPFLSVTFRRGTEVRNRGS